MRHTAVAQGTYQGACLVHARAQPALCHHQQNTTFISNHACSRGDDTGDTLDVCRGCPSYAAQSASQRLHRSSVSRIGDAAARGAASCEQSFFWKRSTDGEIVAKRRSVRFTCSTSKGPGVRHAIHRQE